MKNPQGMNALNFLHGTGTMCEGAQGHCDSADGKVVIKKSNTVGYILYAGGKNADIPIVPGKRYAVSSRMDIKGNASGTLMLSMPGGNRRPFPAKRLTESGQAVILFTAAPAETRLRLHLVVRGQGEVLFKTLSVRELPERDVRKAEGFDALGTLYGTGKMCEGAKGHCDSTAGEVVIQKTNAAGYILYAGDENADVPIIPGKSYEVSSVMAIQGNASGTLMLAIPGGNRRPFPAKRLTESGRAVILFTATPQEKRLRLHFVVHGTGKVVFKTLLVRELPEGNPEQKTYRGRELKTNWQVENALKDTSADEYLGGEANSSTRIVSRKLNWRASEIPALELDLAVTPDGGMVRCYFSGEDNGKKFSSSLARSYVPSGKKQTVTFLFEKQPAWRGVIKQVRFGLDIHSQADFTVSGIRALREANLIPDAGVAGTKEVDMVRPGAKYALYYPSADHPELTLDLVDEDGKMLQRHCLKNGEKKLEFTSPLETVYAIAKYGSSAAYPVLTCLALPFFGDLPEVYWNASWIWPSGSDIIKEVLFSKDFILPDQVERAEIRYTADDRCDVDINGHCFSKNNNLHLTAHRDISDMLQAGPNHIGIKVGNSAGPGGLIFELYAELKNGETFTLRSDRSWRYQYGTFSGFSTELGIPPRGCWGDKIDCNYIGPRIPAQIRKFTEKSLEIQPQKNCPDFGEISMDVVSDCGETRRLRVPFSPRSGVWKPGEWNHVKLAFNSELTAGMKGTSFVLKPVAEFFSVPSGLSCPMTAQEIKHTDFPTVRLIGAGTRPYFEVNGEKIPPFYFDLPFSFVNMPLQKAHFVANAAAGGSKIVRCWNYLRDFWIGPDKFDFSQMDFAIAVIKSKMPDAHIIISCNTFMPDWWLAKNPGDRIHWFKDHANYRNYYQTLGSLKWVNDAQIAIKAMIRHLRDTGNAKNIIGIVFADGETYEWQWGSHPYGSGKLFLFQGNSEADKAHFEKFLIKKYGKLPYPPDIPEPALWNARDEGIFLDPVKSRRVIDYWEYRSHACSLAIRTFAGLVKKETGRKLLSGAYYGYLVQLSRIFFLFQGSGHNRLHEVATSGDCDIYFAPTQYGLRPPGESDGTMQPAEAITVNGGIPIMEFDYRTYSEFDPGQMHNGIADTPMLTLSLLNKGFGLAMTRSAGGHWMELHERWYREPLQYKHIRKLLKLYRSLPTTPANTIRKDVCLVMDEKSILRTANNSSDGVHRALGYELCRLLPRTGAAYRHILLSDLLTPGKVPAHRFYIFQNLFELTDSERAAIKKRLKAENAHALWFYAPGVLKPGERVHASGITEMTGIAVKREDSALELDWKSTPEFGGRIRRAFLRTGLNFLPAGGYDTVIAHSGQRAVVVARKNGGRIDYFSAALVPQEKALQEMFRRAGVWLYQNGTDPIHAGNDILVLHAATGGRKELRIPAGHRVEQLLGPKVSLDAAKPSWEAKPGLTYVFTLKKDHGNLPE